MLHRKIILPSTDNPVLFQKNLEAHPIEAYKKLALAIFRDKRQVENWLGKLMDSLHFFSERTQAHTILLASQSPRRKQLLADLFPKAHITTYATNTEEYDNELGVQLPHQTMLMNIALQKMLYTIFHAPELVRENNFIITCDTLICDRLGQRIGKIDDDENPTQTLLSRMGGMVTGISGIVILDKQHKKVVIDYDKAIVFFLSANQPISLKQKELLRTSAQRLPELQYLVPLLSQKKLLVSDIIAAYVAAGRHQGKAGGFGIQDPEIRACIYGVAGNKTTTIGLPIPIIKKHLGK